MEQFYLSFSIVFPLCFYMFLGFLIRKLNLMTAENFNTLNKAIFKVFIPLMLFISIYQSDFSASVNPSLFLIGCGLILFNFFTLWFILPRIVKEKKDASAMIVGIFRSNYVLFGLTIVSGLYPDGDIGVVSAFSAFTVPLFNMLTVILYEYSRGEKVSPRKLIKGIFSNPLVTSGILGIFFSLIPIPIPVLLENSIAKAGSLASPMALVCLGGILSFSSIKGHMKKLTAVLLGRLVVIPVIALTIFILLGYRNVELAAIMALFGSPTAVASTPMAATMGGNGQLAGEIVAATSVFSILTMFLFIFFLSSFGFL